MRIYVYSDGSHIHHIDRGRAVTIIKTDEDFLGCIVSKGPFVSSSQAELQGFMQGLEYLINNKLDITDVVARVDHESVRDLYYRQKTERHLDCQYSDMWERIKNISKDMNLKVEYIKGHQDTANCNKACDIIAALV